MKTRLLILKLFIVELFLLCKIKIKHYFPAGQINNKQLYTFSSPHTKYNTFSYVLYPSITMQSYLINANFMVAMVNKIIKFIVTGLFLKILKKNSCQLITVDNMVNIGLLKKALTNTEKQYYRVIFYIRLYLCNHTQFEFRISMFCLIDDKYYH